MTIANLAETMWLVQYLWPVEIMYDQGGDLIGHEFKNSLIEQEYGINTNPSSPGNPQANATIERLYQALRNLLHTYNLQDTCVDDADPWMGNLATTYFVVQSMYHHNNNKVRAN